MAHGRQLLADGAHLLDLGGELTAPGSRPITGDEELAAPGARGARAGADRRPLDRHLSCRDRCPLPRARCRIVNDVSALRADPEMAAVVRDLRPVLVMMHAKDGPLPHATDRPAHYRDVVREVGDWLAARVDVALAAGIDARASSCSTPAGASSSASIPAHTWELLARFDELVARLAPIPVLVGISRKGFFGVPMAERDPLSQLTSLVAAQKGAARDPHPRGQDGGAVPRRRRADAAARCRRRRSIADRYAALPAARAAVRSEDRVTPVGPDLAERRQHEIALVHLGMR